MAEFSLRAFGRGGGKVGRNTHPPPQKGRPHASEAGRTQGGRRRSSSDFHTGWRPRERTYFRSPSGCLSILRARRGTRRRRAGGVCTQSNHRGDGWDAARDSCQSAGSGRARGYSIPQNIPADRRPCSRAPKVLSHSYAVNSVCKGGAC